MSYNRPIRNTDNHDNREDKMMKAYMTEETFVMLTKIKTLGYVVSDGDCVCEYSAADAGERLMLSRDWQGFEIVSIEMGSDLRLRIEVREAK